MNQIEQLTQVISQAAEVEEELQGFLSGLAAKNAELKTLAVSIALLSQGLHALAVLHKENREQYSNMVRDLANHMYDEVQEELNGSTPRES